MASTKKREIPNAPNAIFSQAGEPLRLHLARDILCGASADAAPHLARDLAAAYGGALVDPAQNHQPPGFPAVASFRLGRILGVGESLQAAIADWCDRASLRGRA